MNTGYLEPPPPHDWWFDSNDVYPSASYQTLQSQHQWTDLPESHNDHAMEQGLIDWEQYYNTAGQASLGEPERARLKAMEDYLMSGDDEENDEIPPESAYGHLEGESSHAPQTLARSRRKDHDRGQTKEVGKTGGLYHSKLLAYADVILNLRGSHFRDTKSRSTTRSAYIKSLPDEEKIRIMVAPEDTIETLAIEYNQLHPVSSTRERGGERRTRIH
jgi:hypothetical protein